MIDIKCKNCKMTYDIQLFRKKDNSLSSRCQICREYALAFKIKQHCIHSRQPNNCRKCYALQGKESLKKWTITKMVYNFKKSDKYYNRLSEEHSLNFIDYDFIEELIENCDEKCPYCLIDLKYEKYQDDMISIERMNNKLPHIKSNCILCCLSCNKKKVGSL